MIKIILNKEKSKSKIKEIIIIQVVHFQITSKIGQKKSSESESKAKAERLAREKAEAAAKSEADLLSKAKVERDDLLTEIKSFKKLFAESEADKLTDSQNDNENLRAEIDPLKKSLFESESSRKKLNYFQSDSNIHFHFLIGLFSEKVSIVLLLDWKLFRNRIQPNKCHDKLSAEIERIMKKLSTTQQKG